MIFMWQVFINGPGSPRDAWRGILADITRGADGVVGA